MKIAGVILLIFGILNFLAAILAASQGMNRECGQSMSAAVLLSVVGGVLKYYGSKRK